MKYLTWWKRTKKLPPDEEEVLLASIAEKLKTYSPTQRHPPVMFSSRDPQNDQPQPIASKPDVWRIDYQDSAAHDMADKLLNELADAELTKNYL